MGLVIEITPERQDQYDRTQGADRGLKIPEAL
jgi:hypothetical protein